MRLKTLPLLLTCAVLACASSTAPEGSEPAAPEAVDEDASAQAEPAPEPGLTGILDEAGFKALHELRGEAAPAPRGETIDLAGTKSYLSLPADASGPLPAIVVIHEWWGLNDHIRHWADRLAEDGYATLAVDLYGGEVATVPDEAMSLMKGVDEATALAILSAAHDFLAADPRIVADKQGVIGWCFGGGWSLRHAIATSDLDAAVIYYGRPVTDPAELSKIQAPMLGVFANQDEGIPPALVDEFSAAVEAAGKSMEVHRYDAVHAFANPSSGKYDEASASAAWEKVRAFLATHLRGE